MRIPHRETRGLLASLAAFVLGAALIAVGFASLGQARIASSASGTPAAAAPAVKKSPGASEVSPSTWVARATTSSVTALATQTAVATPTPVSTPTSAAPAPRAVVAARVVTPPASSPAASLDAYRGLGSWVDLYDARAWRDPTGTVKDMASHGVRTLFIETSNFHSASAVMNQAALSTFITEAHAQHMKVVAWYLPDLKAKSVDYARVTRAIGFSTPDGQKFDSFALDIEATVVGSESLRNRNLAALSSKIRGFVGPSYALGAIIPSPVGLSKKAGYWNAFPYTMLAGTYDVFVPMGYYTYHGKGASAVYADTTSNVRILRAQPGCSKTPIHLIGGIAESSSAAEVGAFVRAERAGGCFGASLYGWAGTKAAAWRQLQSVTP